MKRGIQGNTLLYISIFLVSEIYFPNNFIEISKLNLIWSELGNVFGVYNIIVIFPCYVIRNICLKRGANLIPLTSHIRKRIYMIESWISPNLLHDVVRSNPGFLYCPCMEKLKHRLNIQEGKKKCFEFLLKKYVSKYVVLLIPPNFPGKRTNFKSKLYFISL